MDIQINEPEYCKINVKYEIGPEEVNPKREEVSLKYRDKPITGFRKGQASFNAVKIFFRKEINRDLVAELAQEAVQNVVSEKNIRPFGRPIFSNAELVSENKFVCEFSLNKQPDFELGQYKEFEIPKPPLEKDLETLSQEMLQEARMKYGETVPYTENDFVQETDRIIIDFSGTVDGVADKEFQGNGSIIDMKDIMIPGFAPNLLGMKAGEERTFEVKLPETMKSNGGKIMKFDVKLLMGSKITPAPLNDELAKKAQVESYDKLVEVVKSIAGTKITQWEKAKLYDQVMRRLVLNHNFEIPSWITEAEAKINIKNNNKDWNDFDDEAKAELLKQSEDNVKLSLILQKVRENEPEAQLTDEEVFNTIKANLEQNSPDPNKTMEEIYKNGHLPLLMGRVRDEHTIEFITKTCKIIE
jgi:trigger factor